MKKKIALLLVAAMTVASLVACGNSAEDAPAAAETEAPAEEAPAEEAEAPAEEAEAPAAEGGSVAVFYYTYGDTYISSVRSALDAAFDAAGVAYQDYDRSEEHTSELQSHAY